MQKQKWHCDGCLNKRATRLRLAVQALATNKAIKNETQKRMGDGRSPLNRVSSVRVPCAAVFEFVVPCGFLIFVYRRRFIGLSNDIKKYHKKRKA